MLLSISAVLAEACLKDRKLDFLANVFFLKMFS